MSNIEYIGEHLLPGKLGHFFVVLSFVSALLSAASYFFSTENRSDEFIASTWKMLGRWAFGIMVASAFAVIGTIFYMMVEQHYEYHYVWSHVSDQLPMQYIFSAFWEGQEGSFLLWIFWHCILGLFLIWKGRKWEAPTMTVLAGVQVFLFSMILGIYFTPEFRLGSSPFLLLRDVMIDAPIFSNANYVEQISGQGLNPLLQNYWMTIHPPTLFLGFAACTIPFCYAVAGFWTRDFSGWLKPVMPWALFAAAVLGTGIAMGGAWAYEALSFGGYWAWDPVENASLVPWLVLIGGLHTNLIARRTGQSVRGAYIFYGLAFFFILYSTFLTRSGILGDSSVHAFTEMGLEWQLIIFMAFFVAVAVYQLAVRSKHIPTPEKEETFTSREFWMFIGSLVLLFSAGLITFTTSIPVFNKLFDLWGSIIGQDMTGWHRATPSDAMEHYNRFQLWIAVFIGLLSGLAQFLRYKEKRWPKYRSTFTKHMSLSLVIAIAVTALANLWIKTTTFPYLLLLFSAIFTVVSNTDYLVSILKGKMKSAAAVFAHLGFGLMIVGVLASGLNKRFISNNPFAMQGIFAESDERLERNIYLIKGKPISMTGYQVTYVSDTLVNNDRSYNVRFTKKTENNMTTLDSFELSPYITYDLGLTKMVNPNPSTKRYLHKDIFSHITSVPAEVQSAELAREFEDSLDYTLYLIGPGDTLKLREGSVVVRDIDLDPSHPEYHREEGDVAFGVTFEAWDSLGRSYLAQPLIAIRKGLYIFSYQDQINDFHLRFRLTEEGLHSIYPDDSKLKYHSYVVQQGDTLSHHNYGIEIVGFDKAPEHSSYVAEDGDVAVAAVLGVKTPDGRQGEVKPIFLIRNNRTFLVKDFDPMLGLSAKFASVDPQAETIQILLAEHDDPNLQIPVEVAENVPRNDFIVLEAIEFPGINFFWLGCVMMMGGLGLGAYRRSRAL
ncbi:MAG: cytochrome c biogenesis protein CcsA [Saprospiraceae bacterium]|nr:cytochrome c biogenesis protein CcsA [Saprospiraceae bacterium]